MKERSQNINMILAFIALIAVIVVVALIGYFTFKERPELIQGQAEVTEYRVSSKIPGRIAEFRVQEGDFVMAGDTLAILESPEIEAKHQQAQAAQAAAEAQSDKAKKGARSEQIQAAYEMWQKAEAGRSVAEKSYERVKNLFDEGVIPAQKLDEVTAQYKAAVATEKAAKAQYDMARNGAESEDKAAAAALVDRAKGAVAEVEAYISESVLLAQTEGEVSEIFPYVGELVGSGAPIMNIAIMDKMWVTFNIREDLLNAMKIGDKINVTIPALKNQQAEIEITYIKDLGTYATWKATKTTGQYDMKTFEVRGVPTQAIDGLRPGMSVLYESK